MKAADLTVVVPTFNGSRYLATTLTSLEKQVGAQLDVLVVDDGSTDGSVQVARTHPLRPRIIQQANLGAAVARNRGLAEAVTPWVSFLDQDDLWHPTRAATLLRLAGEARAAVVATTEQAFAVETDRSELERIGDGREHWPSHWVVEGQEIPTLLESEVEGTDEIELITLERLMAGPATVTTAFMYDRCTAIAAGGCAPFVMAADDHVLNVNIARLVGGIPRVNRPCLFYRVHPNSTTTTSPLAAPYLTMLAALRHGRTLPPEPVSSPFVDHLLHRLDESSLPAVERAALLVLSTAPGARSRWLARSTKQALARRLRGVHDR